MLGILPIPWSSGRAGGGLEQRLARSGVAGAAGLGMLFALSFCPVSAGLFFGALLPLAAGARSPLVLPLIYGVGTGLPVLAFALLIGLGARGVGRMFHALTRFERVASRITGVVFILAGLYLSMTHLLGVSL
jgi:cytochrome c biogenesis protein CcdA